MEHVVCPDCGSDRLERYGKTKAGRQKYRCLTTGCRRQFVSGSTHLIDPETKKIVIALLEQDTPPRKIKAAVPGISMRWLYELRNRTGGLK